MSAGTNEPHSEEFGNNYIAKHPVKTITTAVNNNNKRPVDQTLQLVITKTVTSYIMHLLMHCPPRTSLKQTS